VTKKRKFRMPKYQLNDILQISPIPCEMNFNKNKFEKCKA